jgi:two-component system, LytTR family, response regulator
MRAFIVDDEQLCIDTLTYHLKGIEEIEIIGQASTVNEAILGIAAQRPELVFLDVELPDGTGFDVLKAFPTPSFRIIFITAYDRFAITALRCSAVDYLLKPVDPNELKGAISKVSELNSNDSKVSIEALITNIKRNEERRLVIRTSEDIFLVPISEITHLESDGAYTHIFRTDRKRITVSQHLKHFEEMLMEQSFFRSHQSHLVNIRQIDGFKKNDGGYIILKDGTSIPVSHRKRDALFALFDRLT